MPDRHSFRLGFVLCVAWLMHGCAALWPAPYGEVAADADPVRADGGPNVIPANAPSTLNGHWADYGGHQGIDVLGDVGMPVLAPAGGTVVTSHFELMYGHRIVIEHPVDDGVGYRSVLVHLDARLVDEGDVVRRGQQVARLGRTGLLAGGIPHLHFEVRTRPLEAYRIFEPQNPNRYWVDGPGLITCFDKSRHYPQRPFLITYPVPCRDTDWR